ncbi:MAG: hypothetical protein K2I05_09600, partial [Mailhella sp.]|nr:hypothetical protein [Mailhella sp.]
GNFMSTLCHDFAQSAYNYGSDTKPLGNNFHYLPGGYNSCIGQDALYILKKRAMIRDLWKLIPLDAEEKTQEIENGLLFDLPVICSNPYESYGQFSEKRVPIQ